MSGHPSCSGTTDQSLPSTAVRKSIVWLAPRYLSLGDGALTLKGYFPTVMDTGSPRSRCQQDELLVRTLSCLLSVPSHSLSSARAEREMSGVSPHLSGTLVLSDWEPTLRTSYFLITS